MTFMHDWRGIRRNAFTCGLLMLVAFLLSGCGGDYDNEGRKAFAAGDYRRAIDYLEIAQRGNQDPELRFLVGLCRARLGQIDSALKILASEFLDPERGPAALEALVPPMILAGRAIEIDEPLKAALSRWPDNVNLIMAQSRLLSHLHDIDTSLFKDLLAKEVPATQFAVLEAAVRRLVYETEAAYTSARGSFLKLLETRTGAPPKEALIAGLHQWRGSALNRRKGNERAVEVTDQAFESLLELAEESLTRGDHKSGETWLKGILEFDLAGCKGPGRAAALNASRVTGVTLLRALYEAQGKVGEAIALLEGNLSDPSNAKNPHVVLGNLARLYYTAGDYDKLQSLAERWLRTNAQDPWPSFYKGAALFQKNELEQAVDYLERAQAFAPKAALFNRTLGLAYLKSGDEIRGVNALRKALLLQPHDIDTVLDLARAYQDTGESEKARILLTDGMNNQFRDSTTEAHKKIKEALVVLYQSAGQNIDNISEARIMHARSPDNPFVGLRLAQLESKAGNYEFAGRLVTRVQRALPDLADAWRVGAEVAIGEGRYTQALSALERLQVIDSADPVLPWLRAEALLRLDRLPDAEKEAELAIQRNPKEAGPHLVLLEVHRRAGNAAGMRRLSEFLLVQFPDSKEILRASATAHIALNEHSSALGSLNRLEMMEPQNGEIALDLGKTLLALGKRGEAALKFEKAAQLLSKTAREKSIEACEQLASLDIEAARQQLEVLAGLNLTTPEQVRVQSRLAFLRHHAKEPLLALAATAEIRRTGDMRRSIIQAMRLLQLGRAHSGIAELYEVMNQQQIVTDEGSLLAFEAYLELGQWQKAQAALGAVQAKVLKESPKAVNGMIRALAGSGQVTVAIVQLDKALVGQTGPAAYEQKNLKLRILADSEPEKALAWLPNVTAEAGVDPTPYLVGAEAALALAREDVARPLLLEAMRRRPPALAERLLILTEIVMGMPAEALKRCEQNRNPWSLSVADLIRSQIGLPPATRGGVAEALLLLTSGTGKPAADLRLPKDRGPRTLSNWIAATAHHYAGDAQARKALSAAVLLALVAEDHAALAPLVQKRLTQFAQLVPKIDREIGTLRAWVHNLESKPSLAAGILMDRLGVSNPDPMDLMIFADAAMRNAGAGSVLTILNNTHGNAKLPASIASDLARSLATKGEWAAALELLLRSSAPTEADLLLQSQALARLGRDAEAATAALELPISLQRSDPLVHALVLQATARVSKDSVAASLLSDYAKGALQLSPAACMILADVALLKGSSSEADQFVAAALQNASYEAAAYQRIAARLLRAPQMRSVLRKLEEAFIVIDPREKERVKESAQYFGPIP